jgi:hypothetical protein
MLKIKVVVIHAKFLSHRRPMCESLIDKLNKNEKLKVESEFYTKYDPDSPNVLDIQSMVSLVKTQKIELYDNLVKNMHIKQASNVVKHYNAILEASKSDSDFDYLLVVEDDVMFGDDIASRLATALELFKNDECDILFIGLPSLVPLVENTMVIKPVKEMFKVLPCCDSYVVKRSALERLAGSFAPIRFSTNIQLSYMIETNDFKVGMTLPNLMLDGSKFGLYLSTLESSNRLFLNPEYNQLNAIVRKESYEPSDVSAIENMLDTIKFKNHPDIQFLNGLFEIKRGDFKKAKVIMETVHAVYNQNQCIINNESEFLKVYMGMFKHLQD